MPEGEDLTHRDGYEEIAQRVVSRSLLDSPDNAEFMTGLFHPGERMSLHAQKAGSMYSYLFPGPREYACLDLQSCPLDEAPDFFNKIVDFANDKEIKNFLIKNIPEAWWQTGYVPQMLVPAIIRRYPSMIPVPCFHDDGDENESDIEITFVSTKSDVMHILASMPQHVRMSAEVMSRSRTSSEP